MLTVTKILDGEKNSIVHVFVAGGNGDLKKEVIIDPSNFAMGKFNKFAIDSISYALHGFSAVISFSEGIEGIPALVLSEEQSFTLDLTEYGGLKDMSGADGNGNILLSTYGLNESNKSGMVIIKLHKIR